MTRTEAHRQFYLGVAGIRLWYAREPLPGAAPSPEYEFPATDGIEDPANPAQASVTGKLTTGDIPGPPDASSGLGAERIASLHALMEDKTPPAESVKLRQSSEPETPAPVKATPEAEAALSGETSGRAAKSIALDLGVFSGKDHVLVAQISQEASLRLQETLSGNILGSLGEGQDISCEWICWPVFHNRLVPGNSQADLEVVISQVLRGAGGKKIIVLGDMPGTNAGWLESCLGRAPELEFEHSLAELASDAGLKRALWQQLKTMAAA